ncbi:Blue copper protein [Glycine soja]|uniref:Blue copper protein n=1 Tax=Glycine soja TaxID=3848 RepID=A0A0B2PNZ2_GLYSO|nr:Blue copper protein [Glycine soja]
MAEQHVVGGSQGWDESTDFNSWVSGRTFMVGDQRVFKYSSLHSVVELGSESEYKNCNIGNAVNSMSSGNDVCEIEQAYHTLLCMWYNGSLRSRHEGEDHNSV